MEPDGLIDPPEPAEAPIVYVAMLKLADIVCAAVTLLKVYELTAPTDAPSTRTFAMVYPVFAVMVKVLFAPWLTETEPEGEMVPPVPAEAVMVYEIAEKVALIV